MSMDQPDTALAALHVLDAGLFTEAALMSGEGLRPAAVNALVAVFILAWLTTEGSSDCSGVGGTDCHLPSPGVSLKQDSLSKASSLCVA